MDLCIQKKINPFKKATRNGLQREMQRFEHRRNFIMNPEHKYSMEPMKLRIVEKIGLTEKQFSGWLCHRSIKDKRLTNRDHHVSSGVIQQDHVSGLRQYSCGSVKQAGDWNLATRKVESERLTLHEYYSVEPRNRTYNDAPYGSKSPLRNMPYQVLKFSTDAMMGSKSPRPGPAGYLKVKGQVENNAISAVRRQLGKHYREEGPPLSAVFDLLPPGAFEETVQNPNDGETCYTVDTALPASPDFLKIHQHPMFGKASEFYSSMASHNSNSDRNIPDNYVGQNTTFIKNGAYNPRVLAREISGSDIRGDYGMRYREGPEISRMGSFSRTHYLQPFSDNLRPETIENMPSKLTAKDIVYHNSFDQTQPRQIAEDGKVYANENQIMVPYENARYVRKRMRNKSPQRLHLKKSSVVDNQLRTYQVARSVSAMRFEFRDDETSARTSP